MAHFSGNPKTEWLTDKDGPDRNMRLLENFFYIDPDGKKWDAPKDTVVDGATIPQPLWNTVGSPYTGDYRRASIVHDVACVNAARAADYMGERKKADQMFYHACVTGGCSEPQASILYAGVRVGAWSGALERLSAVAPSGAAATVSTDQLIARKFTAIQDRISEQENYSLEHIDHLITEVLENGDI